MTPPDASMGVEATLEELCGRIAGLAEVIDRQSATLTAELQGLRDQLAEILAEGRGGPMSDASSAAPPDGPPLALAVERLEHTLQTGQAEQTAAAARLSEQWGQAMAALAALEAGRESDRADLERVREHTERLREIVAGLPDVATAQVEAANALAARFEAWEQRAGGLTAAVDGQAAALAEVRGTLPRLAEAVAALPPAQGELTARQRQIAESMHGLYERLTQVIQLLKENVQRLKAMTETPPTQFQELREHIAAESGRLREAQDAALEHAAAAAGRSLLAMILSIVAALAALAAALGVWR